MIKIAALFSSIALFAIPAPSAFCQSKDIIDTALGAGSFNTLAKALDAAHLVDALKKEGPFTVFAPTDEAFAKLPKGTLDDLLKPANRDQLAAVLTYHVASGKVTARDAINAAKAKTLQGEEVRIGIGEGRLMINDSNVIQNDISCSNGIIHVIDEVLLPPSFSEPKGRKVVGIYTDDVTRALEAQLGVKRNKTLLISRVSKDGNAEKAGLKAYDVILFIAGRPATDKNLALAKSETRVNSPIAFDVIRAGKAVTIQVPLGIETH